MYFISSSVIKLICSQYKQSLRILTNAKTIWQPAGSSSSCVTISHVYEGWKKQRWSHYTFEGAHEKCSDTATTSNLQSTDQSVSDITLYTACNLSVSSAKYALSCSYGKKLGIERQVSLFKIYLPFSVE